MLIEEYEYRIVEIQELVLDGSKLIGFYCKLCHVGNSKPIVRMPIWHKSIVDLFNKLADPHLAKEWDKQALINKLPTVNITKIKIEDD